MSQCCEQGNRCTCLSSLSYSICHAIGSQSTEEPNTDEPSLTTSAIVLTESNEITQTSLETTDDVVSPISTSITGESSTKPTLEGVSTSTGAGDNEQTDFESTMSGSESSPLGSNVGYAVGGALGGLAVVTAIAVAVVVIVLLFIKRGQKGSVKVETNGSGVKSFTNAVYDQGQETVSCMRRERCLSTYLYLHIPPYRRYVCFSSYHALYM